jgi:hypothetical protein
MRSYCTYSGRGPSGLQSTRIEHWVLIVVCFSTRRVWLGTVTRVQVPSVMACGYSDQASFSILY